LENLTAPSSFGIPPKHDGYLSNYTVSYGFIQEVPEALSLGVKRLELEADYSSPNSAGVKKSVGLYIHSPICLNGVVFN
jgi:hypothetical protein